MSAFEDFHSSKQMLCDIHEAFTAKGHPEWISSADLLTLLHIMDDRTWDEWSKGKPLNSKDLAALLAPFGIKSKNHRPSNDKDKVVKGYTREDFLASWQRHVAADLQNKLCGTAAPGCGEGTNGLAPLPVAADLQNSTLQNPRPVASSQKPVAASVAAESQDSIQTQQRLVASGQKLEAGRSPVAANPQNPGSDRATVVPGLYNPLQTQNRPVASSQRLVAGRSPNIYEKILQGTQQAANGRSIGLGPTYTPERPLTRYIENLLNHNAKIPPLRKW